MRGIAALLVLVLVACAAEEPIVLPPQEPAVVVLPKPGATSTPSATPSTSTAPTASAATSATAAPPASASAPPMIAAPVATTGLDVPSRDPRLPPRARALVVTEVTALERLLAATAPTSPDRGPLLRRIA